MRRGIVDELTETVSERINIIANSQIRFVVDPRGVTKFCVKEHGNKERFTVSIGSEQHCTCNENERCTHILYILMKFFGVPKDNPLLWQEKFSDREVDLLINGKVKALEPVKPKPLYKTKSGKQKVKRQVIGEDDVCPICYDGIFNCEKSKLAWCRCGCGGNFHRSCVKEWINSRRAYGEEASCPLCRTKLDILGINPPPKKPKDGPPNLTPEEIQDIMSRDLSPDDYALLLRLDEPRQEHSRSENSSQRRRPSNEIRGDRVNIANVLQNRPQSRNPDFDLTINGTGNLVHDQIHEPPQGLARIRVPNTRWPRQHNQQYNEPFIGTVTGQTIVLEDKEPRSTRVTREERDVQNVSTELNVRRNAQQQPSQLPNFESNFHRNPEGTNIARVLRRPLKHAHVPASIIDRSRFSAHLIGQRIDGLEAANLNGVTSEVSGLPSIHSNLQQHERNKPRIFPVRPAVRSRNDNKPRNNQRESPGILSQMCVTAFRSEP